MRSSSRSQAVLERAVEAGVTPSAVAFVSGDARAFSTGVIHQDGPPATSETLFDLASLTKVVAAQPSILRLISDGELALDDRVGRFFSNAGWFQAPSLADVTVRQLLTHTSGLPAWRPLFAELAERQTALAAVLQTPLENPGRPVYSDLGFMLLGAMVERIGGERLDGFARRHVFGPLGMSRTGFGPVSGVDIAATEDCGWRGRLLQGEVHDENATVWDGVAGHAGLFGTAADLARYCTAVLERDVRLGREELLAEAITEQVRGGDGSRIGLGWQLASEGGWAGKGASGFGHTGFTGTSIWIEPGIPGQSGAAGFAVLLTNRVHPHRGLRTGIVDLRRAFHEAVRGEGEEELLTSVDKAHETEQQGES